MRVYTQLPASELRQDLGALGHSGTRKHGHGYGYRYDTTI